MDNLTDTQADRNLQAQKKVFDDLYKAEKPKKDRIDRGKLLIYILIWLLCVALALLLLRSVYLSVSLKKEIRSLLADGEINEALARIDSLPARQRKDYDAELYAAGVALFDAGEYEKALAVFEKVSAYGNVSRYKLECYQRINSYEG